MFSPLQKHQSTYGASRNYSCPDLPNTTLWRMDIKHLYSEIAPGLITSDVQQELKAIDPGAMIYTTI